MSALDNVVSLLEKWPAWKRVSQTPDRVDELEKRVAALEQLIAKAPGETCKACGERAMRRIKTGSRRGDHPNYTQQEYWKCEKCGNEDQWTASMKKDW